MLYVLELGDIEQTLVRQAILAGEEIPERIMNAPTLQEGLQFYLTAFFELDSERNHQFGFAYIPWSAIVSYGRYHDLNEDGIEDLVYFVRELDKEHIKRLQAKQPKS